MNKKKIKIELEYDPGVDGENRLERVFELLLEDEESLQEHSDEERTKKDAGDKAIRNRNNTN